MATAYKLPCQCGNFVQITRSQAGADVVCTCGRTLTAPTLRGFNALEPVESADLGRRSGHSTWSYERGMLAVILLAVGLLCASISGCYAYQRVSIFSGASLDTSLTKEKLINLIDQNREKMSDAEALHWWAHFQERGFTDKFYPLELTTIEVANRLQRVAISFGIAAAICIIGTVVSAFVPLRSSKPNR